MTYRGFALSEGGTGDPLSRDSFNKSDRLFCVYDRKVDPEGFPVTKTKTPDTRTTSWIPQRQVIGMTTQYTLTHSAPQPSLTQQSGSNKNDLILEKWTAPTSDMILENQIVG